MNSTLLRQVNHLQLQMLSNGHTTVDATWNGHIIAPMFSRLYYIVGGRAYITVGNERIRLESGYWYLLPAGCSFDYECIDQMDHVYFHIKLCGYDEVDLLSACNVPLRLDLPLGDIDRQRYSETVVQALQLRQTVEGIVLSLLSAYGITITGEDYSPCVFAALQYIKLHLSMQLTVLEIAEAAAVSVSTLSKQFRKELSLSVGEYIDALVLSAAERQVKTSRDSLREISDRFGFSDQFYFSKRFKQAFGVSPRDYRCRKSL